MRPCSSLSSPHRCRCGDAGYSIVEGIVVLAVISILGAIAMVTVPSRVREARADGEMIRLVSELRRIREMAVSQRRDIEVRFESTNQLRALRQEVPSTVAPTVVSTIQYENGVKYERYAANGVAPDGFTSPSTATAAIDFGTVTAMLFRAEGTFTNGNANLDPLNGTVYLGIYGDRISGRAVTIFGATGTIRGYRWDGARWVE